MCVCTYECAVKIYAAGTSGEFYNYVLFLILQRLLIFVDFIQNARLENNFFHNASARSVLW